MLNWKRAYSNEIQCFRTEGKYEDPRFVHKIDSVGNSAVAEIQGTETIYELKWPKDWTQELEEQMIDDVSCFFRWCFSYILYPETKVNKKFSLKS